MATFTNLYHASDILRFVLANKVAPAPVNGVLANIPPEAIGNKEEIRVSLLWVNEHADHKNDGYVRNPDGTTTPPPTTLSLFYLVTTYGDGPSQNADGAHRLLGEVIRVFSAEPTLTLPLLGGPAGNSGQGKLNITLVPTSPEVMEKVFSPLQIRHRPFALFEVWPVQLKSLLPVGPAGAMVAPGGVTLEGPTATPPPTLSAAVPTMAAEQSFVRLEGNFPEPVTSIRVGSQVIGAFTTLDAEHSLRFQLPVAVKPGVARVTVYANKQASQPIELLVQPSGTWSLQAHSSLKHSAAAALVLLGQGLTSADRLYFWPASGIFDPSDVHWFAKTGSNATSISIAATGLRPGIYRVSARIDLGVGKPKQFTPFILLEIIP
ncbi:MAG: DUF4255 domain-containing protein [Polyangiaceae bacterium]|nr:DUF4255 domain-containing protein [Polyangiaceae bacterium]